MKRKYYDYIIKSPGIVMDDDDSRYTSQTQIFLECYRDNTIGITGTKGKSTTSSLLAHTLKHLGKSVLFGGNIGKPLIDFTDEICYDTTACANEEEVFHDSDIHFALLSDLVIF